MQKMIEMAFASQRRLAIIPMQDWLNIGSEGRMNSPSTAQNNWRWRVKYENFDNTLSENIKKATVFHKRHTDIQ